jgi:hypothetical protein
LVIPTEVYELVLNTPRLTPRKGTIWLPITALVLLAGALWFFTVGRPRMRRLAPLAEVKEGDGIDASEAERIANAFYRAAYGDLEGLATTPVMQDGYWTSTVRIGYMGKPDPEPILINPRTGAVSGPILGRFGTLGAFRQALAHRR